MATKKKILKKKTTTKKENAGVNKKPANKKKMVKKTTPKGTTKKKPGRKPLGDVELVGYLVRASMKDTDNVLFLLKSPHIAQVKTAINEYLGDGHGYEIEVLFKFKLMGKTTKILYVA